MTRRDKRLPPMVPTHAPCGTPLEDAARWPERCSENGRVVYDWYCARCDRPLGDMDDEIAAAPRRSRRPAAMGDLFRRIRANAALAAAALTGSLAETDERYTRALASVTGAPVEAVLTYLDAQAVSASTAYGLAIAGRLEYDGEALAQCELPTLPRVRVECAIEGCGVVAEDGAREGWTTETVRLFGSTGLDVSLCPDCSKRVAEQRDKAERSRVSPFYMSHWTEALDGLRRPKMSPGRCTDAFDFHGVTAPSDDEPRRRSKRGQRAHQKRGRRR